MQSSWHRSTLARPERRWLFSRRTDGIVECWGRGATGRDLSASTGVAITRYGGGDRYATSLLIAEAVTAEAGGTIDTAVLVSGERWTDAVVAAPVAGALGAPVLMTPPDRLRDDALAFLRRAGVTRVMVIGPDASGGDHGPGRGVSAAVLDALTEAGMVTRRVADTNRFSTSVEAAGQITPGVMPGLGRTAIVASGEVFADALVSGRYSAAAGRTCFASSSVGVTRARVPFDSFSAAPLLGRLCVPLVLADPDQIPEDTAAYLDTARAANATVHVRVFGGDAAVSQAAIDGYLAGDDATDAEPAGLPAGTCGGSIDDEPRLLFSSTRAEDASWAPDGTQIAYVRDYWDGING